MTDDPLAALRAEFEAEREASRQREHRALLEAAQLREKLAEARKHADPPNLIRPDAPRDPVFRQSDLRDVSFFQKHKAEIMNAVRHGRIIDDLPGWEIRKAGRERDLARQAAAQNRGR